MFTKYLLCPQLLTEASLIDDSHLSGFLKFLEDRGYANRTIRLYLGAVVHFESWLRTQSRPWSSLPHSDVMIFIDQHLIRCQCSRSFPRHKISVRAALNHWLQIRHPALSLTNNQSVHLPVLDSYDHFLSDVSGLSLSTRQTRRRHALEFLDWFVSKQSIELDQLSAKHLYDYIAVVAPTKSSETVGVTVTSLKSFVNFLVSIESCSVIWTPSLSRPKKPHAIPGTRALNEDELGRLLGAFDCSYAGGKRDYAMARCLIDLGIRTSDVAQLNLDHIDWRRSSVMLAPGKSKRQRTLPMPVTTTAALADYIRHARPVTQDRHIFVHHRAPLGQGVPSSTVRGALRRAFARAGFKDSESQVHRLRHTMATRLLQNKLSLKTIADVLGHLSINTTIRYTHVDQPLPAAVAMPWPARNK